MTKTKFALIFTLLTILGPLPAGAHQQKPPQSECAGALILPPGYRYWSPTQRMRYVKERIQNAGEGETLDELDYVLGINTGDVELRDRESWDHYAEVLADNPYTSVKMLGLKRGHVNWFTDYRDLAKLIEGLNLKPGDSIVDMGAGTGRLGLLIAVLRPDVTYTGIELVKSRVEAGKQAAELLGAEGKVRFIEADLLDPYLKIPVATHYYVYGPTNDINVNYQVVERLNHEMDHDFRVISHHPDTVRILVAENWKILKPVLGHRNEFRIFQKADPARP